MASKKAKPEKPAAKKDKPNATQASKKVAGGAKAKARKGADTDDELVDEIELDETETDEVDDSDVAEIDPDDIDPEALEDDLEDDLLGGDDEAFVAEEDEFEDEDDGDDVSPAARRKASEDEDDDDLTTPDDVEADLDTILKDRLVAADDAPAEDEEDQEVDERAPDGDALQPRRADEELCQSCFLLVRRSAPNCPVGDDACPIFAAS